MLMHVLLLSSLSYVLGAEDTCAADDQLGLWSGLLEQWAISRGAGGRHARILHLPYTNGYYVTDRIDRPSGPPPRSPYDEWPVMTPPTPPTPGKIVNRPPNPYKDKYPSKPVSPQNRPPHKPNPVDRLDEPPRKEVSETDLYLLGAIEKLVYRVDIMEKRLRRMEESVHSLVAGVAHAQRPEPCKTNFTRIEGACYHFSREHSDWKSGNLACRKMNSHLLEMETEQEKRQLIGALQAEEALRGGDYWTGGLNPGLLWIWSNSARAVLTNTTNNAVNEIRGDGRCLSLDFDPSARAYVYRGEDCANKHRYVCEAADDKERLSNEIERVAKSIYSGDRKRPKLMWSDE